MSDTEKKDITVMIDGKKYQMSYAELAQSNSLLIEALVSELTKNKIIDPAELGKTIGEIQKSRIKKQ